MRENFIVRGFRDSRRDVVFHLLFSPKTEKWKTNHKLKIQLGSTRRSKSEQKNDG